MENIQDYDKIIDLVSHLVEYEVMYLLWSKRYKEFLSGAYMQTDVGNNPVEIFDSGP